MCLLVYLVWDAFLASRVGDDKLLTCLIVFSLKPRSGLSEAISLRTGVMVPPFKEIS